MKEKLGYGISGTFCQKISCTGAGANETTKNVSDMHSHFFAGTHVKVL